jgi:hypothetical protein
VQGDPDSALHLLEGFCDAVSKRAQPDPVLLRFLYRAFSKILRHEADANAALRLRRPSYRPREDRSEQNVALAIAVQDELRRDPDLSVTAAALNVAADRSISEASVMRAWREYGEILPTLLDGELAALRGTGSQVKK